MKSRRMYSAEIVTSDSFLEMPVSTQALYFHLGMRADDDGFVNPNVTMRMVGALPDDLKVLIGKRFVIPFENGVVVIKHWRVNNFVRKDRYVETTYLEQKNRLRVKDNGAYTLDENQGIPLLESDWKRDGDQRKTTGQPKVDHRSTQDRIGEDRIGEERRDNSRSAPSIEKKEKKKKPTDEKKVYGEFKNVRLTDIEKKDLIDRYGRITARQMVVQLDLYIASKGVTYKSHHATIRNWARKNGVTETGPGPKVPEKEETEEQGNPELAAKIKTIREEIAAKMKIGGREAIKTPRDSSGTRSNSRVNVKDEECIESGVNVS